MKDFLNRFHNVCINELDHLTVSGNVWFGRDIVLKVNCFNVHIDVRSRCLQGTVIIIANDGERIDIPSGAILENKIVSGNLRIVDH